MRRKVLDMALNTGAGSSHFGGGLSIVDITATLFGEIINYDPKDPQWEDRDRFILSKGHCVLGYYTALSEIGYIEDEDLFSFEKIFANVPIISSASNPSFSKIGILKDFIIFFIYGMAI